MAKQPSAHRPGSGLDNRAGQRQFLFILLIGLAVLALFALGLSQLSPARAQTTSDALNFGNQPVNTPSGPKPATFRNDDSEIPMNVSASLENGTDFSIRDNGCDGNIVPPQESCSVSVVFSPKSTGQKNDIVIFDYNSALGQVNGNSSNSAADGSHGSLTSLTISNPSTNEVQAQTPSTVNLTGVGVAQVSVTPTTTVPTTTVPPTTAPPTTAVPTTTVAATTRASQPACGSQIQGYVLIDGQPGAGIVVNLTGPANNSVTIGEGGYFYFNDLCQGNYQLSLQYDHSKYRANDPDTRKITLDGVNPSRNNAFSLSTITATTAAPTTAAPTTATGNTPAPTTPAVTTTAPASEPDCNIPAGTVLRVCVASTQQSPTHFAVVLKVLAGDSPVDLNDTVIINLPAGAVVTSATSALGAVSVTSNNTVRWGSFSLSPKQSANIVLSIDAPSGNLNGSSIFVSGSFNRSQAFQQRIPGLPGLTDIVPAAPQGTGTNTGTGGQGGGKPTPAPVPSQVPSTGTGQENNQDTPVIWLVLAAIVSGGLGVFGLFLTGRGHKADKKEQK